MRHDVWVGRSEALVERLGARARAFLKATRSERRGDTSSRAELARRYRRYGDGFVDVVTRFEERYGGWEIDPRRSEIELGVGSLLARGIDPVVDDDARVALVGTGSNEDIYLSLDVDPQRAGWLHVSRADRIVGELATSVEKWIERLAALAAPPFPRRRFVFETVTEHEPLVSALSLRPDPEASDATFLLATSPDLVLERHVLGTPWLRGRSNVVCRTFDSLVRVLEVAHAAELSGAVAIGVKATSEPMAEPVDEKALVRSLRDLTQLVVEGEAGATHLMSDRRIECFWRDDDGRVTTHVTLRPKTVVRREYVEPW